MRSPRLAASAVAILLLLPSSGAAQASPYAVMPDEGEDFCARIFLRAQGRTFGHEFAELFFLPSVEGDPEAALAPDLEGPVRADRAALWWTVAADSLAAYMVGDGGTVWELRLGRTPRVFRGSLRQTFPGGDSPHVATAYVMRTPCRREGT